MGCSMGSLFKNQGDIFAIGKAEISGLPEANNCRNKAIKKYLLKRIQGIYPGFGST